MDRDTKERVGTSESTGGTTPESDSPSIVDNRRNKRLLEEIEESGDYDLYKKTPNRLSPLRWKLGEEPDAPGNNPDDGWVNLKLEVTEHPEEDPDQMEVLQGGPTIRIPCFHCGGSMHVASSKTAKEMLEESGWFEFPEDFTFPDEMIVACVCFNGHVTQVRGSFLNGVME